MAPKDPSLIVVGAIAGAHGVRGDVRIKSFTAEPEALFDYAPFFSESGQILITPTAARPAKNHFIVTAKERRQKEEWDALKSTRLYVPRDALPETGEDEFYISDLIGLDVFTGGEASIGKVKAVLDHGAGDLIEVAPKDGAKPVLIPFTLEDVPTVDLKTGRLIVTSYDLWADETNPSEDE